MACPSYCSIAFPGVMEAAETGLYRLPPFSKVPPSPEEARERPRYLAGNTRQLAMGVRRFSAPKMARWMMLKFLVTFLVKFDICIVVVCCSESWKLKWSSAGDLLLMAKDFEIWNDWKIIGWWFEIIRLYIDDIYDKWIWIIKSMFRFQCFSVVMIRIHFPIFQGVETTNQVLKVYANLAWRGWKRQFVATGVGWLVVLYFFLSLSFLLCQNWRTRLWFHQRHSSKWCRPPTSSYCW